MYSWGLSQKVKWKQGTFQNETDCLGFSSIQERSFDSYLFVSTKSVTGDVNALRSKHLNGSGARRKTELHLAKYVWNVGLICREEEELVVGFAKEREALLWLYICKAMLATF